MFEKRKKQKFISKIQKTPNKEYIENLYFSENKKIKDDVEICEIIFATDKSLLRMLPTKFQLSKLNSVNGIDGVIKFASKEVQIQFLKNNFNKTNISIYNSNNLSQIVIDLVMGDVSLLNEIHDSFTIQTLINLLYEKALLEKIIENPVLNNKEIMLHALKKDVSLLKNVSCNIRMEYFLSNIQSDYMDLFIYLTEEEKEVMFFKIIEANKEKDFIYSNVSLLINNMSNKTQKNIIMKDLNLLKWCNEEVQLEMFEQDNQLIYFLNENVRSSLISKNPKLLSSLNINYSSKSDYSNAFSDLRDINYEDLNIKNLISAPVFSAKGSLLKIDSTNGDYEMLYGINQYCASQYEFFKKMPVEQLARLCMYDVNYILPAIAIDDEQDLLMAQTKVKNVFGIMYGQDFKNKYSPIIDSIFANYKYDYSNNSNCILDSLKLIFNKDIIKNNNVDLVNDYIQSNINGNLNKEIFNTLIFNSYGKPAQDILNSRPNLNEHNINSLEVFNKKIIDTFGIGLVHDLLSYNISNMSYFLAIAKNNTRINFLADLYKLESNLYGANIATFQQTLNDFASLESLLMDIDDNELTATDLENLYSVIQNHNFGNISKREELSNYQNIVFKKLFNEIKDIDDVEFIKEKICNAIFGINYSGKFRYDRNQSVSSHLLNLYENSNAYNNELLSANEVIMLDFLSIILKENNKDTICRILNNLCDENALGNFALTSAINKLKENQEKLLNDNLISVPKLENELEKNTGLVVKTTLLGVPVYVLNGLEFGTLTHSISGTNNEYITQITNGNSLDNIETLEEQYGSSTISTWYKSNNTYENEKSLNNDNTQTCCFIGFSEIPKYSIVGMDEPATSRDISTDHAPKLSTAYTHGSINFDRMHENSYMAQEVSFYRKLRDQSLISNANHGGRFDFDYFCGDIYLEDLNNLNDILKRLHGDAGIGLFKEAYLRNKPIILINTYAYSKSVLNCLEQENERMRSL